MSFSELGLEPELTRAVADKGYDAPTPIQRQAIPAVLAGRDLLAGAQTGTGKTAGFVLPLLQKLGRAAGRAPRVLVLTPTRELAAQVAQSATDYGAHKNLRVRVIFGGVGENPQIEGLRRGCDILVATPGRLLDLANRRLADLSKVEHFVLDEADRMLDMGFIHDIRRVIQMLPAERQNLLFSATYTDDIRTLAARLLRNPVHVEVTPRNSTVERVEQPAGRGDEDVAARAQAVDLRLLTHAAEYDPRAQVLVRAVVGRALRDLGREFAGRRQHQHARRAAPGVAELLQQGQHEAGRLAGARLGAGQHVAAREHGGNGLLLDGGGNFVALVGYGTDQLGLEPENGKRH